ncbi:TlpA disulfide reductase family protein [Chitinophaga sp. S165]|uniref:TlpA disulfide reductase family protein n=1 Tax=Chitinophaga sp. S165 TaxID=2135462 RepID=UPI001304B892|nr:TlpA disulfide reductase family protein [Chitinophaga sp. S165]
MKLLFFFLVTPVVALAQHSYSVKGEVPDYFNGKTVYLSVFDNYSDTRYETKDSATVVDNSFAFSGKIAQVSEAARISYKNEEQQTFSQEFVLDSGNNNMIVHPVPADYIYYKNKVSILSFPHSASNSIKLQLDSISSYYMRVYGEYADSARQFIVLPFQCDREKLEKQQTLLAGYKNNYYTIIQLYRLYRRRVSLYDLDNALKLLDDNLQKTPLYKELLHKVTIDIAGNERARVNEKMPSFTVKTSTGTLFTNTQLAGTPYIVVFSATWCIPCQEVLPGLKTIYKENKKKGLQVVYFNLDDDVKKWQKHINKHQLDWINVSTYSKFELNNELTDLFNIKAVPGYIVVNKDGKIVFNSYQVKNNDVSLLKEHVSKMLTNSL